MHLLRQLRRYGTVQRLPQLRRRICPAPGAAVNRTAQRRIARPAPGLDRTGVSEMGSRRPGGFHCRRPRHRPGAHVSPYRRWLASAAASALRNAIRACQIRSASDFPSETTVTADKLATVSKSTRLTNSANAFASRDGKAKGIGKGKGSAVVFELLTGTPPTSSTRATSRLRDVRRRAISIRCVGSQDRILSARRISPRESRFINPDDFLPVASEERLTVPGRGEKPVGCETVITAGSIFGRAIRGHSPAPSAPSR